MWSRSLKLVSLMVGLLACLFIGPTRSVATSLPSEPVQSMFTHIGWRTRFRSKVKVSFRAMRGSNSSMRLAPGSQDRSQLRMPPSLAQVVAMLQGGNTTNIIIGVLIVLVLVQGKKNTVDIAFLRRELAVHSEGSRFLRQELQAARAKEAARDAAKKTPALNQENISLLVREEVRSRLLSWITPSPMPGEHEGISGCDLHADFLRGSRNKSGGNRSTAADAAVAVLNRSNNAGDEEEDEGAGKVGEQDGQDDAKQLQQMRTCNVVVDELRVRASQVQHAVEVELNKTATMTSAGMKRLAEDGVNTIRVIASDRLGVGAEAGQVFASQVVNRVHGEIDKGKGVAEGVLRSWCTQAFALVGLSREDKSL